MKRSVVWVLLSYSVLVLTAVPMHAQEAEPERKTLVLEPGNDFRVTLEKGVRIKAPGQPITARLLEPVYAGEALAIPAGTTVKGHVSAISKAPRSVLGSVKNSRARWPRCENRIRCSDWVKPS